MALEPLGLARLSDKLGTLYLHYQNAYDHQTCGLATYNEFPPIVSLDPSIMCGLARSYDKLNNFFSTWTRPMDTKHRKLLIYCEGLSFIKSNNPLNTWSFDVS